MNKEKIREQILSKRHVLSKTDTAAKSKKIFHKLIAVSEFKKAKIVMFYVSKDNEVSTLQAIDHALKNKQTVCVPKIDAVNHLLHPVVIRDPSTDLKKGHFGVHEPVFDIGKLVPIHNIDLIIVPGIAFDMRGHRLGWGKGYYDRFLEKAEKIHKIGLAFEFQVVPLLPKDKHDVPVDKVVTEKRMIEAIKDWRKT